MDQQKPILADVEAFLTTTGMSATAFGKSALGDPKFVPQLRKGRRLWPETEKRAREFISAHAVAQ